MGYHQDVPDDWNRVYVASEKEAPDDAIVREGRRGRLYYCPQERGRNHHVGGDKDNELLEQRENQSVFGKPFTGPDGQEFEDFDHCVTTLTDSGTSADEAEAICGRWQEEYKRMSLNNKIKAEVSKCIARKGDTPMGVPNSAQSASDPSEIPDGATTFEGPRGGTYYVTTDDLVDEAVMQNMDEVMVQADDVLFDHAEQMAGASATEINQEARPEIEDTIRDFVTEELGMEHSGELDDRQLDQFNEAIAEATDNIMESIGLTEQDLHTMGIQTEPEPDPEFYSDDEKLRDDWEKRLERDEDPCWEGYTMVGTKENGDPRCVPEEEAENYDPDKSAGVDAETIKRDVWENLRTLYPDETLEEHDEYTDVEATDPELTEGVETEEEYDEMQEEIAAEIEDMVEF